MRRFQIHLDRRVRTSVKLRPITIKMNLPLQITELFQFQNCCLSNGFQWPISANALRTCLGTSSDNNATSKIRFTLGKVKDINMSVHDIPEGELIKSYQSTYNIKEPSNLV